MHQRSFLRYVGSRIPVSGNISSPAYRKPSFSSTFREATFSGIYAYLVRLRDADMKGQDGVTPSISVQRTGRLVITPAVPSMLLTGYLAFPSRHSARWSNEHFGRNAKRCMQTTNHADG